MTEFGTDSIPGTHAQPPKMAAHFLRSRWRTQ
jgi:hypothetical protein